MKDLYQEVADEINRRHSLTISGRDIKRYAFSFVYLEIKPENFEGLKTFLVYNYELWLIGTGVIAPTGLLK